ncbi:hypothetical protein [Kaarinaea lacus]
MDEITPDTIISDILIEYPELTDYLMEKQLCRADSGPYSVMSLRLSEAAKLKDLNLDLLLSELNSKI